MQNHALRPTVTIGAPVPYTVPPYPMVLRSLLQGLYGSTKAGPRCLRGLRVLQPLLEAPAVVVELRPVTAAAQGAREGGALAGGRVGGHWGTLGIAENIAKSNGGIIG